MDFGRATIVDAVMSLDFWKEKGYFHDKPIVHRRLTKKLQAA